MQKPPAYKGTNDMSKKTKNRKGKVDEKGESIVNRLEFDEPFLDPICPRKPPRVTPCLAPQIQQTLAYCLQTQVN